MSVRLGGVENAGERVPAPGQQHLAAQRLDLGGVEEGEQLGLRAVRREDC